MLRLFPLCPVFQPLAKYVYLAQDHCFVGVCKGQALLHSAIHGKYWPPSLWCEGPVCCIIGCFPNLSSRQLGSTNLEKRIQKNTLEPVPLRNEPTLSEKCPGWHSTVNVLTETRGKAE